MADAAQACAASAPLWNSLEAVKLLASTLTPAAIAMLGIYVHRVSKRFEDRQWKSQKLIEKRLEIYDEIAPDLNDLLCYFTYVGCWKEMTPPEVVKRKRSVDRKLYLAQPLFPPTFFNAANDFMDLCFKTHSGWGRDARLRTNFKRRSAATQNWTAEYEVCFAPAEEVSDPQSIRVAYQNVMAEFTASFEMFIQSEELHLGRLPANIR
jgi:hypothetical protein